MKTWKQKLFPVLMSVLLVANMALLGANLTLMQRSGVTQNLFTIGTADASSPVDYYCNGAQDDVQFKAALDSLPATGGIIRFLSGNYVFTTTVSRAIDNVIIEGVGAGAYITHDNTTPIFSAGLQDGWTFRDFSTDGGGITTTSATRWTFESLTIYSTYYAYETSEDIAGSSWAVPTGRTATLTVAASNATATEKAQADYVVVGTADDEIQAALDIVALSGYSGNVHLTSGLFTTDSTIFIPNQSYITLEGCGPTATQLYLGTNSNCAIIAKDTPGTIKYRDTIRDIGLNGNSANNATGTYGIDATGMDNAFIDHVYITDTKSTGLYSEGNSGFLSHSLFSTCGGYGLHIKAAAGWQISDVITYNNASGGIFLQNCYEISGTNINLDQDHGHSLYLGGSRRCHFSNVYCAPMHQYSAGLYFIDSYDSTVTGGSFYPPVTADANTYGIYFYASTGKICQNILVTGFTMDGRSASYVRGIRETIDGTGLIAGCKVVNSSFILLYENRAATSNTRSVIFEGNVGYIAPGEIRTASVTFTGGGQNTILCSWHNPEAQDIYIMKVVGNVSALDSDNANIDWGIADNATYVNGGTEFFNDLAGETIKVNDSWLAGDGGTQTKWVLCQDSASATDGWVVAKILDADGSSITGTGIIQYCGA